MRTADYSQEARDRLAAAVAAARKAAGHRFRPSFAKAAGVGIRSLENVESLEPDAASVGDTVLEAIGRALPNWTEDTPRIVLEGGAIPVHKPEPAAESQELAPLDEVLEADLDGLKTLAKMYAWYEARRAKRSPNTADQERFMLWALKVRAERRDIEPRSGTERDVS